jgi:hypothetical protein
MDGSGKLLGFREYSFHRRDAEIAEKTKRFATDINQMNTDGNYKFIFSSV